MAEVVIDIKIQDHGAPEQLKKTDGALDSLKKQAGELSDELDKTEGSFGRTTTASAGMWKQFLLGGLVLGLIAGYFFRRRERYTY